MSQTLSVSEMLYYSFLSGAAAVDEKKHYLNQINVFPVPDGDTGNNLMSTLNTIIEETKVDRSIKATLASMADAALTGARGNSGIIFAQFINGVNEEMKDEEPLDLHRFASLLKGAVPYVYSGITNPKEGTMITVIKAWVDSIHTLKDKARSFEELLAETLAEAKRALQRTPEQLEVLRKASVLDSGAAGFVMFLEGGASFLKHKDVAHLKRPEGKLDAASGHLDYHGEVHFRYCTEAMLSGENLDAEAIRRLLEGMGDSLIVAGNSSRLRVHIHTDSPVQVMAMLSEKAAVKQQKVDDMVFQQLIQESRLSDTAIVTDSIADIPRELLDRWQVHVVPLPIRVDDHEYLDKTTLETDQVYRYMGRTEGYPSTSQPSIRDIENRLAYLSGVYKQVLAVTVSSEMSGTYNAFVQAAEKLNSKGASIRVVDSKVNSGAEGLLVLQAARMLADGAGLDEAARWLEESRARTRIYVSLDTLKYMVRGGRVSPMKGFAAKVMNLKPIVSIDADGKGIVPDKAFSTRGNMEKILSQAEKDHKEKTILAYSIVHADNMEKVEAFAERLRAITGLEPSFIAEISAVVALNAGIGATAVSYTTER